MTFDLGRWLPRSGRGAIAFLHDLAMTALSLPLALFMRLGAEAWSGTQPYLWSSIGLLTAIALPVYLGFGLYRGIWRYASMNDLLAIARAVALTLLLFLAALFIVTRLDGFPRSALAIEAVLLPMMLGGPRFAYRIWRDRGFQHLLERGADGLRVPVLLLGAGDAAEQFVRAMKRDRQAPYRVVGILDDGRSRIGGAIQGIEVLESWQGFQRAVERLQAKGERPQRLVICGAALEGTALAQLLETADGLGMTLARAPRLADLRQGIGGARRAALQPVAVEDLLGRPHRKLDRGKLEGLIAGRRVLVTGAGGSIGGELSRQIAALAPAALVLLDQSELALYAIDREIGEAHGNLGHALELCDIRDGARLARLFARHRPEIVFHAAALKHVPLTEAHADETLRTNLLATRHLARACRDFQVAAMVTISTDKAVAPASLLGASKRAAELYCLALDRAGAPGAPRFVTVRFGNVLGSSGSVVPLFQRQLAAGGPLTLTDPRVERYFMTLGEAVELTLQGAAFALGDPASGAGSARGKLLVLDMGAPVKILDLARQMIRLAGKHPERDIAIAVTGLRPGEKLTEALFHDEEKPEATAVEGVWQVDCRPLDLDRLEGAIDSLTELCHKGDRAGLIQALCALLPEYRPAPIPADRDPIQS